MNDARIALTTACVAVISTLVIAAPQAVAAPTKTCADHHGQLYAFEKSVRVWHDETSLRSCIVSGRGRKSTRRFMRLGSWREGTRFAGAASGLAVWLAPVRNASGQFTGADRIWARSLHGGPVLLTGIKAQLTVTGSPVDGPIDAVRLSDGFVAWTSVDGAYVTVTSRYQVIHGPERDYAQDQIDRGEVVTLGTWPGKADRLAATLTIGTWESEGDECDHTYWIPVSVTPDVTPVGVTLSYGTTNPAPVCNGGRRT